LSPTIKNKFEKEVKIELNKTKPLAEQKGLPPKLNNK
jgi:hypothetical protein